MTKYEEEVRRIAMKLAKLYYGHAHETSPPEVQEQDADGHIRQAVEMVREMANEYEVAYFSNYGGDEDSDDYMLWNHNCISEMKERGLIPDDKQ